MTYDPSSMSHQYPLPLDELVACLKASDDENSDNLVLVFRDSAGGQVSFLLPRKRLQPLIQKLSAGPT